MRLKMMKEKTHMEKKTHRVLAWISLLEWLVAVPVLLSFIVASWTLRR